MKLRIVTCVLASMWALSGCGAPGAPEATSEPEELKSAECPANIEVTVSAPDIPSNESLAKVYEKEFREEGEPDPGKEAADQVAQIAPWLAKARGDKAVSLTGAIGKACAYATFDAKTHERSDRKIWLARSSGMNGTLSLR